MNRLKDLREDRDLKQKDVAEILGISQQYYQCYESEKYEIPLRHCITLAKYYNVSLDYITGIVPLPRHLNDLNVVPVTQAQIKLLEKYSVFNL